MGGGTKLTSGELGSAAQRFIDQALLDQMILYVVYATSPGTWSELPSS